MLFEPKCLLGLATQKVPQTFEQHLKIALKIYVSLCVPLNQNPWTVHRLCQINERPILLILRCGDRAMQSNCDWAPQLQHLH